MGEQNHTNLQSQRDVNSRSVHPHVVRSGTAGPGPGPLQETNMLLVLHLSKRNVPSSFNVNKGLGQQEMFKDSQIQTNNSALGSFRLKMTGLEMKILKHKFYPYELTNLQETSAG